MAKSLNEEMVASYGVSIIGIRRTKAELARLDGAIRSLRSANYSSGAGVGGPITVSQARFGTSRGDKLLKGSKDIFSAQVDMLEGRIQTAAVAAVGKAVTKGKVVQAQALRAAETAKGRSGQPEGRKGTGRNVTGTMIKAISTNVEVSKTTATTTILGWHGWQRDRADYFEYQEQGTKGRPSGQAPDSYNRLVKRRRKRAVAGRGVPAANSLGAAIIIVREYLKTELARMKK